MFHTYWQSITHHDSSQGITATGSAYLTIIKYHWLSKTPHDSQPLKQYKSPWFTTKGSGTLSMIPATG
jgi:hypothetical protein